MPDNIGYTPGYGAQIAADDVGGTLVQRVKPVFGVDGQAVDVSTLNPLPVELTQSLIDAIENLRVTINSMNRRDNLVTTDGVGRQRILIDNASIMSTVGSVNQINNIIGGNISTFGGAGTFEVVKAASRTGYNTGVRGNLSFS